MFEIARRFMTVRNSHDVSNGKNNPRFYKEILQAWDEIRYCTTLKDIDTMNNESTDVLNQIDWHNKHRLFNKHSLFYKEWYVKCIVYLGDLVSSKWFPVTCIYYVRDSF